MKRKKINRGLIVTGAVVLGVIIYLIIAGVIDSADSRTLKKMAEEYVTHELSYHHFDESVTGAEKIPASAVRTRLEEFRLDAADYFLDADCLRTSAVQIEDLLAAQTDGTVPVVTALSFHVISQSTSFEDNTACVTVYLRTEFETKAGNGQNVGTATLEYEKTPHGWKLTFAQINDGVNSYFGFGPEPWYEEGVYLD